VWTLEYLAGNWNKVTLVKLINLDRVWRVPHLSQVWEVMPEKVAVRRMGRSRGY